MNCRFFTVATGMIWAMCVPCLGQMKAHRQPASQPTTLPYTIIDTDQINFKDNGDGTITDRATGLMWMKVDSGKLKAGPKSCAKVSQKSKDRPAPVPLLSRPCRLICVLIYWEYDSLVQYCDSPEKHERIL